MTAPHPHPVGVDRLVTPVLAEIAQVLVPAEDKEARLLRALELLRRIVPYDQCAVAEVLPNGEPLVSLLPEPSPLAMSTLAPTLLHLLGRVSESGAWSGRLDDAERSTIEETWGSYLAVPLVGSDRVDGLLLVCQRVADAYDEDDLRLLSIVGSQIAAYLTTCRLWAQEVLVARERPAQPEARAASDGRERVGPVHAAAGRLTRRQLEIARLISTGQSNAQIARELVLTPGTVANHIENILRRLKVSNRAQVATWVATHGLLSDDGRP